MNENVIYKYNNIELRIWFIHIKLSKFLTMNYWFSFKRSHILD